MKAILPILICSAITGLLGYYYGQISKPVIGADSSSAVSQSGGSAPAYSQPKATSTQTVAHSSSTTTAQPTSPNPAATSNATASNPTSSTSTASTSSNQSAFAARAAKPTQTLTDTKGRSMQVSILDVTATEVEIRRTSDGWETSIPLNMLSKEDIAFCNYLREQNQKQNQNQNMVTPANSDGFDWDSYFNS